MKFRRKKHSIETRWAEVAAAADAVGWRLVVTLASPDSDLIDLTKEKDLAAQIEAVNATLTDPVYVAFRTARDRAVKAIKSHEMWASLAAGSLERARAAMAEEEEARATLRTVAALRVGAESEGMA